MHAGNDPKPLPPPVKLCREMVDAMGGADSDMYRRFRSLACEAYNILRKSAPLLLSLAHLMAGSSIPDIRAAPETALLKLQARSPCCMPPARAAGRLSIFRAAPGLVAVLSGHVSVTEEVCLLMCCRTEGRAVPWHVFAHGSAAAMSVVWSCPCLPLAGDLVIRQNSLVLS